MGEKNAGQDAGYKEHSVNLGIVAMAVSMLAELRYESGQKKRHSGPEINQINPNKL